MLTDQPAPPAQFTSRFRILRSAVRRLPLIALGLVLILPAEAFAHLYLRGSDPAAGADLAVVPERISLDFSEPVELPLSMVSLIGPLGEVPLGELRHSPGSPMIVLVDILGELRAGDYTVRWQAVGLDGHPVRGELEFQIDEGAEGLPLPEPDVEEPEPVAVQPTAPPSPPAEPFDVQSPLYAAVRWITYLGMLGVIGSAAFALFVLARTEVGDAAALAHFREAASRAAAGVGILAVLLLGVAIPLRLQAQSHALFGQGITFERFSTLLGTAWGFAWLVQAIAAIFALLGLVLVRRWGRAGWLLAGSAAVVLAFTPGFSGHAAATETFRLPALIADGIHVLGAGTWVGTLLLVMLVGVPLALRQREELKGTLLASLLHNFTPLALASAALVVATGLFASWLHLTALSDLWESAYGRVLLLKLAFVAAVFAAGAFNWRRLQPRSYDPRTAVPLRRSAGFEIAVAIAVVAVTAVLVAVPPPAYQADARPHQALESDIQQ